MTPEIQKLINEFKAKLQEANIAMLLVYAWKDPITNQDRCQIASDAGQQGIRAILHAILRLTDEGTLVLARAFEDVARAASGVHTAALDKAAKAGAFLQSAKGVFQSLRPHWTIDGWEDDERQIPS